MSMEAYIHKIKMMERGAHYCVSAILGELLPLKFHGAQTKARPAFCTIYTTQSHILPLHKPQQSLSLSHKHTDSQSRNLSFTVWKTMKQKTVSYALLLLFVFLITSSQISAGRFLPNKQGKEEEVKLENGTNTQLIKPETTDSLEVSICCF